MTSLLKEVKNFIDTLSGSNKKEGEKEEKKQVKDSSTVTGMLMQSILDATQAKKDGYKSVVATKKAVNLQELRKYETELIDIENIDRNNLVWIEKEPFRHQYISSAVEISIMKDCVSNVEYFFIQHGGLDGLDGLDSFIVPVLAAKTKTCWEIHYGDKNHPVISYIYDNYNIESDYQDDVCKILR